MSPSYHRGELAVQARADLLGPAGNAVRAIRTSMPPVAAAFLAEQPAIVLGAADGSGRLWSTMIFGTPGFIRAPSEDTVVIDGRPAPPDPLAEALGVPAQVGMLAIEPATRRRMRVNGRSRPDGAGLVIDLDQVIANCPKYIQKRTPQPAGAGVPVLTHQGSALTAPQQELIRQADTFFISTADERGAADASHRGGNPGFVLVPAADRLVWPDYVGNAMFLTLGNLEVNPAAGLLFVDWRSGTTLHLSGTAATDFSTERAAEFPGAQRVVEFSIAAVVEISSGSPLIWDAPEYSRFNPPPAVPSPTGPSPTGFTRS